MSDFGERLRKMRRDRDVTQRQLAKYLGVAAAAVAKYEKFPNAYPSVKVLIKIADYFSVSTDYLLRGIQTQPTENNVNSDLNNSTVIQANRGRTVVNGEQMASMEADYLRGVYGKLDVRDRLKLLNFAVDLEEKSKFKTES